MVGDRSLEHYMMSPPFAAVSTEPRHTPTHADYNPFRRMAEYERPQAQRCKILALAGRYAVDRRAAKCLFRNYSHPRHCRQIDRSLVLFQVLRADRRLYEYDHD